jgi:hypothetical protein
MNEESRPARRLPNNNITGGKPNSRCGSRTALQEATLRIGDVFEFARAELDVHGFETWLSVLTCKVAHENARLLLRERRAA